MPVSLSTDQLFASIRELAPKVAVFDCDGTLWHPDSGSGFMRWSTKTGLFSPQQSAWIEGRHAEYHDGKVDEITICGEMVQVYEGLTEQAIRASAAEFFRSEIEPFIFPEMFDLVSDLRKKGVEIWAVSSTCDWVVEEGVRRFGIPPERVLAACVEVKDGVATRTLRDVPSDENKAISLRRVGHHTPDAVFGNSIHDAAMLEIAKRAYPVNPSAALVEISHGKGWPVYYPAAVRTV
ncbi:HAD family hydrolase [Terriglobus tenax]|uniref:HAD family hydrolase n=1 Tax=Terriglobus tenax TaxID=1111115 RepID=UPI0021E088FC|nr:haloacid dehalogenase-like hydrolase [Terriglobus tenax]